jgi:hypothetical protein
LPYGLGRRRDDPRHYPADILEARRAEADGDAGRGRLGAAAAGGQRDGQGVDAGVPVAEDAVRGVHGEIEDLARAKGVHATYVSRVLRLTLLAPDIVEAILDGRQSAKAQLDDLLAGFPLEWEEQSSLIYVETDDRTPISVANCRISAS